MTAHADLARWCRSKHLTDEARAHWLQVLVEDSSNDEAQSALGLRWYAGNLMTTADIQSVKAQRSQELHDLLDWKPTVARWQKQVASKDSAERAKAAAEMRQDG